MANLTLADYVSLCLGDMNENRTSPEKNRKITETDVIRAINRGRRKIMRKVGVSIYRNSNIMDATAGDIVPPADFFSQAIVHYNDSASDTPIALVSADARVLDRTETGWRTRTGKPSRIAFDFTTAGIVARLVPQPTSTVTDGLTWYYNASLTDLAADSDTCPVMNAFPEFQETLIPAGALPVLYLLEGGEADDQVAKWDAIFARDIADLQAAINGIAVAPGAIVGNQSYNR